jgi:hypothetical protein
MNPKTILTSKFQYQKDNFEIHDELDKYIKRFIIRLNKSPNIVTLYSCEGVGFGRNTSNTTHSIVPYLGINVDEEHWDLLWTKVIPEIMMRVEIQVSTNFYEEVIFIHGANVRKEKFWKAVFEIFGKYFIENQK